MVEKSKQYDWDDIIETSWTNVELGTTEGYKFPCGKTYPSEFYTKNEAIEDHNIGFCRRCDSKKYNLTESEKIADKLNEELKDFSLHVGSSTNNDIKDLYAVVKDLSGSLSLNYNQIETIKKLGGFFSEKYGGLWYIPLKRELTK